MGLSSYDLETGIRRTTLDAQGRCLSVYFEVPVFEEATAGYRKINAFFEELTERLVKISSRSAYSPASTRSASPNSSPVSVRKV